MEIIAKEYTVKRLDVSRLKDLALLHTLVYGQAPASQHYTRKYATAYTGVEYLGYIAYHPNGEPLAYYGVIPCFIQYKDRIVLAAQSADTMTNPRHRQKGLFVELSMITFELCRREGIGFIFGFPNQNSYHGAVNRLGWQEMHTMERFDIPVDTLLSLESVAGRFGWSKRLYDRYIDTVLRKYTLAQPGLNNAFLREGYSGIYRDERYLLYRTYSASRVIQAGAAQVWMRSRGGLVIGDINPGDASLNDTMRILSRLASRTGLARISFIVSPGTGVHAWMAARYTPEPSFPVLVQDLGATIPISELRFSYSDIDIF